MTVPKQPSEIRLVTDDYHLQHFGKLEDGNCVLVSSQLHYDTIAQQTTDYVCRFCFNSEGELVDHTILEIGVRGEYVYEEGQKAHKSLLSVMKPADLCIKPFSVEFDGKQFGFIVRVPETDEDVWAVEFMPGNTMAFFEPWNDGLYDT